MDAIELENRLLKKEVALQNMATLKNELVAALKLALELAPTDKPTLVHESGFIFRTIREALAAAQEE